MFYSEEAINNQQSICQCVHASLVHIDYFKVFFPWWQSFRDDACFDSYERLGADRGQRTGPGTLLFCEAVLCFVLSSVQPLTRPEPQYHADASANQRPVWELWTNKRPVPAPIPNILGGTGCGHPGLGPGYDVPDYNNFTKNRSRLDLKCSNYMGRRS